LNFEFGLTITADWMPDICLFTVITTKNINELTKINLALIARRQAERNRSPVKIETPSIVAVIV
jgi:hypothetical protein